jgi:hypothetical protein
MDCAWLRCLAEECAVQEQIIFGTARGLDFSRRLAGKRSVIPEIAATSQRNQQTVKSVSGGLYAIAGIHGWLSNYKTQTSLGVAASLTSSVFGFN